MWQTCSCFSFELKLFDPESELLVNVCDNDEMYLTLSLQRDEMLLPHRLNKWP